MFEFEPTIIRGVTPQEVYDNALECLERKGREIEVRGKKTKELLNVNLFSSQPGFIDAESIDLPYIYQEISNILSREHCKMDHPEFVKEYLNPSGDRVNLFWGDEVRAALNEESLQRVIDYLNDTPDTRRAVLGFSINEMFTEPEVEVNINEGCIDSRDSYYVPDYIEDPSEVPCLVFGHFIKRNNELHFQVQTRSADVYLGVPYDYYLFQNIHLIVAAKTNNRVGDFIYKAISLHKYTGGKKEEV